MTGSDKPMTLSTTMVDFRRFVFKLEQLHQNIWQWRGLISAKITSRLIKTAVEDYDKFNYDFTDER